MLEQQTAPGSAVNANIAMARMCYDRAKELGSASSLRLFFFNDTATTEIYTLSLHDALPICCQSVAGARGASLWTALIAAWIRSEEHTSELQSHVNLVCRLLLEKKKVAP